MIILRVKEFSKHGITIFDRLYNSILEDISQKINVQLDELKNKANYKHKLHYTDITKGNDKRLITITYDSNSWDAELDLKNKTWKYL